MIAITLLLLVTILICKKIDQSISTAVSIVVGLLSLFPAIGTFIKRDLRKYKEDDLAE